MRFLHKLGSEAIAQSESTSFLIARKAGGYLSLGTPNVTRYQGLCVLLPWGDTWELFKAIESISIQEKPHSIVLHEDSVERVSVNALEHFAVQTQATTYKVSHYTGDVRITLDMRQIHDFDEWGRHYTIQDVPGGHVVTYSCPRYTFCLAILGAKAKWEPAWRSVHYPYDERRKSPANYSVHDCLNYHCAGSLELRFGIGYTPQDALERANNTQPQAHYLHTDDHNAALRAAVNDLDGLILELPRLGLGIFAGYPWFYQVYNRDEAISTGALIALGNTDEAKRILLRSLEHLHDDGRIGNRFPASEISSADGVGWTFLRLSQLHARGALNIQEIDQVHEYLVRSLTGLESHRFKDGLITNNWKETWMDTTGGSADGRQGARIEIQALTARMYQFCSQLSAVRGDGDEEYYRQKEQLLRSAVRERFFDPQGILADGIDDHVDRTVRPNMFLAAYAYPELLSDEEWRAVSKRALKALWLPWGGLATIDKEHLLFTPEYSGETDTSYHRGDSWYFVNNFAAMVLARIGLATEAQALFLSSQSQLLSQGIPGHAAEVSSAQSREAYGCFSQAWSAATFVEAYFALQALRLLPS